MEKAYKLLAKQQGISNKKAKEIIDRGLVFVGDKKVKIARAELADDTRFRVEDVADVKILYEDDNIVAINKPAQVDSYDIQDAIDGAELLHRLDRDTSGVLLLGRNREFIDDAINEFKNRRVKKEYVAWVEGVIYEEIEIDAPILTIKKGKAFSKIDDTKGKKAYTKVKPLEIQGKKSKVSIEIKTGRTHQIRVHLAHIGHPIVGDEQYGSRTQTKRILLHSAKMAIFNYAFEAAEPKDILRYK
ncbi:FIG000124: Ribosomal large subunit pseudouridine synthase D [hydrothermal vent metagenome]|uniref:FIG000124: Ribosomal large subunit pseudouridine synthase D n=1 Tax=hydrothermal vent metagenome TaxID=652676 RepID=A0A1W1BI56_9ZZZZ